MKQQRFSPEELLDFATGPLNTTFILTEAFGFFFIENEYIYI